MISNLRKSGRPLQIKQISGNGQNGQNGSNGAAGINGINAPGSVIRVKSINFKQKNILKHLQTKHLNSKR